MDQVRSVTHERRDVSRLLDGHVHFWDPIARHHDWLKDEPRLNRPFVPSDLLAAPDAPGSVIFVEADCRGNEALDEVDWVVSLGEAGAPIAGIVAHGPLERPDELAGFLAAAADRPLVVGVRRLLQHEPPEVLRNAGLIAGSQLLASHGLAFDICITAEQLPAVTTLVAKCPDTTFVLDHVGKPPIASGVLDSWRSNLRALAACDNVACKLSGLTTLAQPGWRPEDILPQLDFAIDVFGPDRCIFGSDWPVMKLNSSYAEWLTVVTEATSRLTASERAGVFAWNAARVYRLERTHRRDGDRSRS